ncbi:MULTISPECIES: hypothetical protein [Rhizobium]|uniref:hypothetical protein n=1 Tax=Rhizobium TaxID=379 RepID=UPI001A917884|nr:MULTISPECIES: hypothetical protein [Rhizobium]MBY3121474.1 hypothetical protein [Rhizobium laguerreae]MBY3131780.1 hypothetical protein [Rhizobium laguerreae]MBY3168940.1 hypothetical protein [Rhizobium laguerreae]MBY5555752.1 hypothetical protein [Rhizobium leguminosarum]MBY5637463.1 hypothetical protein [Rhizobium leguminosarum]
MRVLPACFLRQLLGRGNVIAGQKCGELIASIERQDGVENIELFGELSHIALVPR